MASDPFHTSSAPLVSVIVPTYNYGRFIGQTLASVQAQTYVVWECIVVDDGSTDDTREIVEAFARNDPRIKYLHQANQGLSATRNVGIKKSGGAYLQFLDADDLIEAHKLASHVEYLERHAEADIVYGEARYFSDEKAQERRYSIREEDQAWMPEASGEGTEILKFLARGNIMPVHCPLLRRKVVEDAGLFDEALPALEDWDYWICCAARGKRFDYLKAMETRALVRFHPASLSRNSERMIAASLILQTKLRNAAIDADANVAGIYRMLIAHLEGWMGIEEVMRGNAWQGARRLFKTGTISGKMKWHVYALISLLVSRQRFEKLTRLSAARFINALRQNPIKRSR